MPEQSVWLRPVAARRTQRPQRPRNLPARKFRRRLVQLAVSFTLFALLVAGVIYGVKRHAAQSPTFQVRNVIISGGNVLRDDTILAAAGVRQGDNLYDVDPQSIASDIEKLAYVKSCSVQRAYPDRLVIQLVERVPVATLLHGGRIYEVDRDGIVLREVEGPEPHVVPLITNLPDLGALAAGQRLDNEALQQALLLWEAWQTIPLAGTLTLSELSAEADTNLRMFLEEIPFELRWGRSNYRVQVQRLQALWDQQGGTLPCQEYLDLRFDQDLACK